MQRPKGRKEVRVLQRAYRRASGWREQRANRVNGSIKIFILTEWILFYVTLGVTRGYLAWELLARLIFCLSNPSVPNQIYFFINPIFQSLPSPLMWGWSKNLYLYSWAFCFPGGSNNKESSACNVGDLSSIPALGRSPPERNGNSLQYSCLENFMDRGAWWATVHGAPKSQTGLSDFYLGFLSSSIMRKQTSVI